MTVRRTIIHRDGQRWPSRDVEACRSRHPANRTGDVTWEDADYTTLNFDLIWHDEDTGEQVPSPLVIYVNQLAFPDEHEPPPMIDTKPNEEYL